MRAGAVTVGVTEGEKTVLRAKALFLRSGPHCAAFCVLDADSAGPELIEVAAERLQAHASGIGRENLLISATGIPQPRGSRLTRVPFSDDKVNRAAIETAASLVAQAVSGAEAAQVPVRVRIGEAEAPEFQHLQQGAGASADSTVSVLAVESLNGEAVAYLVNFALFPMLVEAKDVAACQETLSALTESLAGTEMKTPVLFINGAAGDIGLNLPPDGPKSLGAGLGEKVRAALQGASPSSEAALRCWAHSAGAPPSLAYGQSEEIMLREVRLGNSAFFSMPGLPAGQIGLFMRVKALAHGLEHAFLLANTGASLGVQSTIEEYFAVTDNASMSEHGPLWMLWYGQNHFGYLGGDPVWSDIPALARFSAAFRTGLERGAQLRPRIAAAWESESSKMAAVASALLKSDKPSNAASAIPALPESAAAQCYLAARLLRSQYADFTEEERATLMGVAEGSRTSFDLILFMQILSDPNRLPAATRPLAVSCPSASIDFLVHQDSA